MNTASGKAYLISPFARVARNGETQTASDLAGTLQATGLRAWSEKPSRITPLAGAIAAQPVS